MSVQPAEIHEHRHFRDGEPVGVHYGDGRGICPTCLRCTWEGCRNPRHHLKCKLPPGGHNPQFEGLEK